MTNIFFLYSEAIMRHHSDELQAAVEIFGAKNIGTQITDIPKGSLVIPRYRFIPFGKELSKDIENLGSKCINSYVEHRNIADLWNWVTLLSEKNLTAPAYTVDDLPHLPEGEWFVKGETNSLKHNWFQACYAPTTTALPEVLRTNWQDTTIGTQTLVIRPYRHYRVIGDSVNGRPIFNERRAFVYKDRVLGYADYWSSYPEYKVAALDENLFQDKLKQSVNETLHLAPFRVIDFAEFPDGNWEIVELNDGVMSGLSDNSAEEIYTNLKKLSQMN